MRVLVAVGPQLGKMIGNVVSDRHFPTIFNQILNIFGKLFVRTVPPNNFVFGRTCLTKKFAIWQDMSTKSQVANIRKISS